MDGARTYGRNVVANLLSRGVSIALGLLVPPLVAKKMGLEAYGVIGLYGILGTALSLLDLGLSTTVTRSVAVLKAQGGREQDIADVRRTFSVLFWAIASAAGLGLVVASDFIARQWVNPVTIEPEVISSAVRWMAVALAFQFPQPVSGGVLSGLGQQVRYGVVVSVSAVIRAMGTLATVYLVAPTVEAYFAWQLVSTAAMTLSLSLAAGSAVGATARPLTFRLGLIRQELGFAIPAWLTSALGIGLTLSDKVVVSKLLSLEDVGTYTLSSTASAALYSFITPVFAATFPMLTQRVIQAPETLGPTYFRSTRLMGALVVSPALTLAAFSREAALAWTGNTALAAQIEWPLRMLALAALFHGFAHLPYALSLAKGASHLGLWTNAVSLAVLVPTQWVLCIGYGAVGAAAAWFVLMVLVVVLGAWFVHRRFLTHQHGRWLLQIVSALALHVAVVMAARVLAPVVSERQAATVLLCIVGGVLAVVTFGTSAELRMLVQRRSVTEAANV